MLKPMSIAGDHRSAAIASQEDLTVATRRPTRSRGNNGAVSPVAVAFKPTLAAAVNPPPIVPVRDKLVWSLADITALTGFSRSLLERELSAGKMPEPDLRKGRRMVWRPSTIRRWLGEEEP
jgi:hypothetical protein